MSLSDMAFCGGSMKLYGQLLFVGFPIFAILLFASSNTMIGCMALSTTGLTRGVIIPRNVLLSNSLNGSTTKILSYSNGNTDIHHTQIFSPKNIGIVGGGLAGLSTTFHLLKYCADRNIDLPSITIIDKSLPGEGGASSVAGGLLHPFSPKGKLIYLGLEGLEVSNTLIEVAQQYQPDCILRQKLYRLALTEGNVKSLQQTASLFPELATWLDPEEIEDQCRATTNSLGGITLTNGCKVIDVPNYLRGLWKACQKLSKFTAKWSLIDYSALTIDSSMQFWKYQLEHYDTVIFAAGNGLFTDSILQSEAESLPVEIVRGQSIEMKLDNDSTTKRSYPNEALLCGKYIAPLVGKNRVLIGATHEYKKEPLNNDEVVNDLSSRSSNLANFVWENGKVERITEGYRVQSQRGKYGRMPIIGKSQSHELHPNSWLFTGLSSRGLIYHGVLGKILSEAILKDNESSILKEFPDAFWWKK